MKSAVLFLLFVCTLQAQAPFYLSNGDRVVFYGDSITDQRLYDAYVEAFVVTLSVIKNSFEGLFRNMNDLYFPCRGRRCVIVEFAWECCDVFLSIMQGVVVSQVSRSAGTKMLQSTPQWARQAASDQLYRW
jgi:hypothetical protein